MIVSTNNRNTAAPGGVKRQKQKWMWIKIHFRLNASPAVFFIYMSVHLFFHQYNRYQREIQEKKIQNLFSFSFFPGLAGSGTVHRRLNGLVI
jgi:hypothetical protein